MVSFKSLLTFITLAFFLIGASMVAAAPKAACNEPITVGLCKALIPRYAYDSDKKACTSFNYGGCGGNGNNFETAEACKAACEA